MKHKPKSPDGSGAYRTVKKSGEFALEISMNFTPAKGKAGWVEIPKEPVKIDQAKEDE